MVFVPPRALSRLFSLFLVGVLGTALNPASADIIHSPKGYTVTIPQGWQTHHEVQSHSEGRSTDMMYAHPPDKFPLFRIEVDPQGRATIAGAEAMQAAFVQTKVRGFRLLKQRLRPVAGSPASETAAIGPFQGQTVIMDMIYTIHAGWGYTITLITTPRTARADQNTFVHILNTLHWN